MNKYIGHPSQLYGVFEKRLVGGKSDGMRLFEVQNGLGLRFVISADRCADLPYLYFKGMNIGYIAPCGMVSSKYYDNKDVGFLKSFTAGFMTICGLTTVGSPCIDNGEHLPLHGNISNTPAESICYFEDDNFITFKAIIRDASLFSNQLILEREYICSLSENKLAIRDTVKNIGCREMPFMILYHINIGYPLLSENCVLDIPSYSVSARNDHAKKDICKWSKIDPPKSIFEEQCYYHTFKHNPTISLYNPMIGMKMSLDYSLDDFDCFTQWKMLGDYEYVLGLEPGNCYPDGRNVMREKQMLKFLQPGETKTQILNFSFYEDKQK